jgi:hypothetical protein
MKRPLVDRVPFAKIFIGIAILFLLSCGLCGVSGIIAMDPKAGHGAMNGLIGPSAGLGLVGLMASIAALGLTCMVWFVLAIIGSTGKGLPQPEIPPNERGDKNGR